MVSGRLPRAPPRPPPQGAILSLPGDGSLAGPGRPPATFCPNSLPGHRPHPSGSTKPDSPQCCGLCPPTRSRAPQNQAPLIGQVPSAWHGGFRSITRVSPPVPILALPVAPALCPFICETGTWRHPPSWGSRGGELPRVRAETGLACGVAWSVGYPCVSLPRHALCACLQAGARGSLGTSLCSGLFHVHTAGKGLRGTLEETS